MQTHYRQGWEFDLYIFDLSILSFLKKDWPWSYRSRRFFDHKKRLIRTKKNLFWVCFWPVPPLFMPKDRIALVDLRSFLNSTGLIHSRWSLKKIDLWESEINWYIFQNITRAFSPYHIGALLYKVTDSIFLRSNRSYAHKNEWFDWKTDDRIPNPDYSISNCILTVFMAAYLLQTKHWA